VKKNTQKFWLLLNFQYLAGTEGQQEARQLRRRKGLQWRQLSGDSKAQP